MKRNPALNQLIELSSHIDWSTQHLLRSIEDDLAKDRVYSRIDNLDKRTRRYLRFTSLPFCFGEPRANINYMWGCVDCRACSSVVFRHTVVTGNLSPDLMVIGDAPGIGDGELVDHFDRVFTYGLSSRLLRRALIKTGDYWNACFSNILKCSTPGNRPSTQDEVDNCHPFITNELRLLKPKRILVLGAHAKGMLDNIDAPVSYAKHPSYFIRSGLDFRQYSDHITEVMK